MRSSSESSLGSETAASPDEPAELGLRITVSPLAGDSETGSAPLTENTQQDDRLRKLCQYL